MAEVVKGMTKAEFVKSCVAGGYCDKKTALEYAGDRNSFDGNDLKEVYRHYEKMNTHGNGRWRPMINGVRTTKRYKTESC